MSLADALNIVREAVVTLAAAGGLAIAWGDLSTWRIQLKHTAEWQVARRLLVSVYAVRDAIRVVRSPMMMAREIASARDAAAKDLVAPDRPVAAIDDEAAVYEQRWNRIVKAFSELDVARLAAVRMAGVKYADETAWFLHGDLVWLWLAATQLLRVFHVDPRRTAVAAR